MLVIAQATGPAVWITLFIGVVGLVGLIFTALRFRRDDTTAVVTQQQAIVAGMKTLNEELRAQAATLRIERDEFKEKVQALTEQVEQLRNELQEANRRVEGGLGRIERKIEEDGGK